MEGNEEVCHKQINNNAGVEKILSEQTNTLNITNASNSVIILLSRLFKRKRNLQN